MCSDECSSSSDDFSLLAVFCIYMTLKTSADYLKTGSLFLPPLHSTMLLLRVFRLRHPGPYRLSSSSLTRALRVIVPNPRLSSSQDRSIAFQRLYPHDTTPASGPVCLYAPTRSRSMRAFSVRHLSALHSKSTESSADADGPPDVQPPSAASSPEAQSDARLGGIKTQVSGKGAIHVDIKRDQQLFLKMFSPLKEALLTRIAACAPKEEAGALSAYYSELINYNCLGGKLMRGLLTVYASLAATHELRFANPASAPPPAAAAAAAAASPAAAAPRPCESSAAAAVPTADAAAEEAFLSPVCFLGWGVELLQASFLVADDQIDGASTRRGKVCWYRRPDVGPANAINDSVFLIFAIHQVMVGFLQNHGALNGCVDLLQQVAFKTVLGQHLDTSGHVHLLKQQLPLQQLLQQDAAAAEAECKALANLVRIRQAAAARLKTSYYSFWLPTALGLRYSGVDDPFLLEKVKLTSLATGDYFQAQDDYLDCFGCPDALGKAGSDIREGKCTWLLAKALDAATPSQAADLLKNYGTAEGEEAVREVYVHLNVHQKFKDYERRAREDIMRRVDGLNHAGLQSYFAALLQMLYRRSQ